MTYKHLILLVMLTSCINASGQTFNDRFFLQTSWFSNDKDSSFFKSDTIRLIKYSNLGPTGYTQEKAENESKYLNHGDRVELTFYKKKKLGLTSTRQNYIGSFIPGWTWIINSKTNLLAVSLSNVFHFTFRPVSQRQIKLSSRFALQPDSLTTTELTLVRTK